MGPVVNQPAFRDAQVQKLARGSDVLYGNERYHFNYSANNKGADQTAWMRGLSCVLVVRQAK